MAETSQSVAGLAEHQVRPEDRIYRVQTEESLGSGPLNWKDSRLGSRGPSLFPLNNLYKSIHHSTVLRYISSIIFHNKQLLHVLHLGHLRLHDLHHLQSSHLQYRELHRELHHILLLVLQLHLPGSRSQFYICRSHRCWRRKIMIFNFFSFPTHQYSPSALP